MGDRQRSCHLGGEAQSPSPKLHQQNSLCSINDHSKNSESQISSVLIAESLQNHKLIQRFETAIKSCLGGSLR